MPLDAVPLIVIVPLLAGMVVHLEVVVVWFKLYPLTQTVELLQSELVVQDDPSVPVPVPVPDPEEEELLLSADRISRFFVVSSFFSLLLGQLIKSAARIENMGRV